MDDTLRTLLAVVFRGAALLLVANEVRGFALAAPILYGMYQAGGSIMAIWIGFCSLAGVALSVVVPMALATRIRRKLGLVIN